MAVLGKRTLGCSVAFLNQIEETSPYMEELSDRMVYYLASYIGWDVDKEQDEAHIGELTDFCPPPALFLV